MKSNWLMHKHNYVPQIPLVISLLCLTVHISEFINFHAKKPSMKIGYLGTPTSNKEPSDNQLLR